jgi:uncharacterized coiled-coil protein SlyX
LDETSPGSPKAAEIRPVAETREVPSEDEVSGEPAKGVPYGLVALVCLLLGGVILWQYQQASALESKVAGLEQALRKQNALLNAHRVHLDGIRGGVSDLVERLSGLQGLVESDPERDVRIPFAAPSARTDRPAGN